MRIFVLLILSALLGTLATAEPFAVDPSVLLSNDTALSEARETLIEVQRRPDTCTPDMKLRKAYVHIGEAGITRATPSMLAVAYAVHQALENDQGLRNHLVALIRLDLSDVNYENIIPGEFGGVGFLPSESVEFLPVTNTGRYQLKTYRNKLGHNTTSLTSGHVNGLYKLPDWARANITTYTFGFHLHATHNQRDVSACTPSFAINHTNGSYLGDISYAAGQAQRFDTVSHEFIIGKHDDESFSVTYIGAMMDESEPTGWFAVVIPLRRYPL